MFIEIEMLNDIKVYWRSLKTQYEDRYDEAFLDQYEHSKALKNIEV